MKANSIKWTRLIVLGLAMLLMAPTFAAKKEKLRMKADFINDLDNGAYVEISVKAKGEDGIAPVEGIEISCYVYNEDTSLLITELVTNKDGIALMPFSFKDWALDTSGLFQLEFKAKGSDSYKKASKSIEVRESALSVEIEGEDGVYTASISLTDVRTGEGVGEEEVFIGVERLFKPLPIGEGVYYTEEDGTVIVEFEDSIPSLDGNLNFIIKVNESGTYGTVIKHLSKPFAYVPEREDTFDERTMWSPPNKTPLVLLIFPNLIILAVWSIVVMLVINLFKIKALNKK